MSRALDIETTIAGPASAVWDALTDWEHAPRWISGIESMTADGPTAVGTELTFRARGKERSSSIAGVDDGRSVLLRSVQGGVTADYAYEVHPLGDDRTRVTLVATCQMNGVMWKAMGPVIRFAMRRADAGQLDALKAVVEAGSAHD